MNPIPCTVCGEDGHRCQKCPTLSSPLKDGFYAPPQGHRPSGDDDDERAKFERPARNTAVKQPKCLLRSLKLVTV